eukprot:Gb_17910 [translate_table: standard]
MISFSVFCVQKTIILAFCFALLSALQPCLSQLIWPARPESVSVAPVYYCHKHVLFADDSVFSGNLNTVLDNLVHNASLLGFGTSSHGERLDKVYGLLECRGDISQNECYNCTKEAIITVRNDCGNGVGGQVWLDKCSLRYGNYSFVSQTDSVLYIANPTTALNSTNPKVFNTALRSLLNILAKNASSPANIKRFATGLAIYSSFQKIYGLVQCWRDISSDDCNACLAAAFEYISSCCGGRLGAQSVQGSCIVRYEIFPFFHNSTLSSISVEVPANTGSFAPPSNTTSSENLGKNAILILGVVGSVEALGFIICLLAMRRKLKALVFWKQNIVRQDEGTVGLRFVPWITEGDNGDRSESLMNQEQMIFDMEALAVATGNFDSANKLGAGGFGPVYKGTIPDGRTIAVKKLSLRSAQGKREFLNEVNLVAKVQHRNLVKLLGCCAEGAERLIVYEYLPNKSLDTILFDPQRRRHLDWEKRYNIIVGVARGLLYLHEDSPLRIVHRDIKASNILLDEKLNPKIADFGLARLFPEEETHVSTRIAGTYGYMAPEYAMQGEFSVKVDVYSFGVLLLEILTGRKNTDFNLSAERQSLSIWAWRLYKRGNIVDTIDEAIIEACPLQQAIRCVQVGLLCTQADAAARPSISTVILMVSGDYRMPDPTQPALLSIIDEGDSSISNAGHRDLEKDDLSNTSVQPSSDTSAFSTSPLVQTSTNDASISEVEPR